jgi:integrase
MDRPEYWKPVRRVNKKRRKDGSEYEVVRWVARHPTPEGRTKSAGTFDSKSEAAQAIRDAMDKAWGPADAGPARSATVREYVPRWFEDHPRGARSAEAYRSRLNQMLEVVVEGKPIGDWDLRALRYRQANLLIGKLFEQDRSPRGVKNIVSTLQTMTADAVRDEFCEVNPWLGIRISKSDERGKRTAEPRMWTFKQLHEWAAKAPGPIAQAMLRVLIDCGLRHGELLALERDQWVKAGDRYIDQHGKEVLAADPMLLVRHAAWRGRIVQSSAEKNHHRDVPVTPAADRLLREMPRALRSKWLFTTKTGRMWQESNFEHRILHKTNERAGYAPTPREIRRSYVSNLRGMGIDPADLAKVTGHTVETATKFYTLPLEQSHEAIRKAIEG